MIKIWYLILGSVVGALWNDQLNLLLSQLKESNAQLTSLWVPPIAHTRDKLSRLMNQDVFSTDRMVQLATSNPDDLPLLMSTLSKQHYTRQMSILMVKSQLRIAWINALISDSNDLQSSSLEYQVFRDLYAQTVQRIQSILETLRQHTLGFSAYFEESQGIVVKQSRSSVDNIIRLLKNADSSVSLGLYRYIIQGMNKLLSDIEADQREISSLRNLEHYRSQNFPKIKSWLHRRESSEIQKALTMSQSRVSTNRENLFSLQSILRRMYKELDFKSLGLDVSQELKINAKILKPRELLKRIAKGTRWVLKTVIRVLW